MLRSSGLVWSGRAKCWINAVKTQNKDKSKITKLNMFRHRTWLNLDANQLISSLAQMQRWCKKLINVDVIS